MASLQGYTVTLRYRKRRFTTNFYTGRGWKHDPSAADVVCSLSSDAQSYQPTPAYEESFEQWASDHEYDPDSREAERIYTAIVREVAQLQRWLGPAVYEELLSVEC